MILSSAFDDIVSPRDLATAIMGIPHGGAKLQLYRDTGGQRTATKIVVQCDKPTASRLRHRFSTSSSTAYVHHGQVASLKFAGMRPVVTGHHLPAKVAFSRRGVVAVASTARIEPASLRNIDLALSPPSSSVGVEIALEMVDRDEAIADLRVPGISELYQEFQRSAGGTRGDVMHMGERRRRRRGAHANEEKLDGSIGRDYGEGKLSDLDTTCSEECGGYSSSETERGSSTDDLDPFGWDDGHRVGRGETKKAPGQRRRRRRCRHHPRARREEAGDRKPV